ncbi:Mfa1 family fimbria major subunit [Segatella copri]|uniref:Mfa1 family fimbria major subunit n=1 Tax=Segatella copri TaxID=165179 RepID=UPI001C45E6AE|nr:Mfa1 family fimbria major subunit [Segatella copri]MBW0047254.1 Mfa1 family fimbria major subunit [Segatella copri]
MKIKHLFGLAVIAAMTASCSSNNDLVNGGNGSSKNETGTAYASFKINLPTTSGTRADVDPDGTPGFNEGTAAEYEVKNGTILIFDKDGKFVESADLGTMNPWTNVQENGVTTAAIATVQLKDVSVKGSYKALVLLNNNTKDDKTKKVTLPNPGVTYATWNEDASNANAVNYAKTDGIFMANAPMYTDKTTEPTTLVDIKGVYASKEEAQANPATTIYVERGLAKVTMKDFETKGYSIGDNTTYAGATVKIEKWQLDVTNNSTYPVHKTSGLKTAWDQIWNTPRFYDKTSTAFQRVYWGVDPNYNNADYLDLANCKTAFKMIENKDVTGAAGDANPQYCLENTFDLNNMKQGQTTRVVFKAVFTPNGFTAPATFYKIGNNTAIWKEADLKQQIKTVALTAMGITDDKEQAKYDVKLDATTNNISGEAGQHLIKAENITYTDEAASSEVKENVVKKINEKLTAINEKLGLSAETGISTYLNGEAYYIARIKHFNELTPWKAGEAYGSENEKYLGRYGVLRNNWYELSVNKVSGLGYPDVPEVKPTLPDDENDQYISVSVKILSWAKRSQKIDL